MASLEQHPADRRSAPHGLSTRGTLYQIDWKANQLAPRQPLSEQDWDTILGVLREHELTSLDAGGQMTDAVLERLSHQDQITCLRLGGCKQLTDVGVLHLARMPQLVELDLSDHPGGRLTDRGLDVLRSLPALRRFQMCWQSGISDSGVANLAILRPPRKRQLARHADRRRCRQSPARQASASSLQDRTNGHGCGPAAFS